MNQKLYAFWSYDQFPYCLWGEIEKFNGEKIYIPSYLGWFKPFKIIEGEKAEELISRLLSLKRDRDKKIYETRAEYNGLLKDILPEALD